MDDISFILLLTILISTLTSTLICYYLIPKLVHETNEQLLKMSKEKWDKLRHNS
jgi:hypothetical protein